MRGLMQDLRYAARFLVRAPETALIAVFTLALGIGATTAVWSLLDRVLLAPLPYPDPDRVVRIYEVLDGAEPIPIMSAPNFLAYRSENTTFQSLAAFQNRQFDYRDGDQPETLTAAFVTAGYFNVLGFEPILGRVFSEDEERGNDRVVIVSHDVWRRHLGADPEIVGRLITLNDRGYTVVGVMPAELEHPESDDAGLWAPAPLYSVDSARARWLSVIGRMKADISIPEAAADLAVIGARLAERFPVANTNYMVQTEDLHRYLTGDAEPLLYLLAGTVGFVLLISCANVTNLLLARAASRRHEIGVRRALGAGRIQLIRQLLTERALLAMAGGAGGVVLAYWGTRAAVPLLPDVMTAAGPIAIDQRMLLFTFAVSLAAGLLVGLAPAFQASGVNPAAAIGDRSRRQGGGGNMGGRIRNVLVVAEIGLALASLVGAGLMMRSLGSLQAEDTGFDAERVLTLRVKPHWAQFSGGRPDPVFYRDLLERIENLPNVVSVGGSSSIPTTARGRGWTIRAEGQVTTGDDLFARPNLIAGDYLTALGVPLVGGRFFEESDDPDVQGIAIINETLARRLWPGQDPIGRPITALNRFELQIVGVVGDVRDALDEDALPKIYVPYKQFLGELRAMMLAIRTTTDAVSVAPDVRAVAQAMDDRIIIDRIQTMDQVRGGLVADERFATLMLGIFSAIALVLAAAGIYGVMSHAVVRRTGEIGVRRALGARGQDLVLMVLGQGFRLIGAGIALGMLGSFLLTRILSNRLWGVSAPDPWTMTAVALLLAAIGLLACYVPARRATRVDPMIALRYE